MKRGCVFLLGLLFLLSACSFVQERQEEVFEGIILENTSEVQEETFEENSVEEDHASVEESSEDNEEEALIPYRNSPEIPSELERQSLPDCEGLAFTVAPVDLQEVYSIAPLGNIAPPGHTFPTEHSYMHLQTGGESTELYALYSPADVSITSISRGSGYTQDPYDYTIYFALCKDVIGYYNHVKELSPALEKIESSGNCREQGSNYRYCENALDLVPAGELMGKVGRLQGNFDFGLIDLRENLAFVNPDRYGERSLHIQCAYDYYETGLREELYALLVGGDCGKTMFDVAGTLQGNWFYADAQADSGSDWDKYLSFVYDNEDPTLAVVSIGGVISDAMTIEFTPQNKGTLNRDFADVEVDGTIYCYESTLQEGSVLVELQDEETLLIEYQNSACTGDYSFSKAYTYER